MPAFRSVEMSMVNGGEASGTDWTTVAECFATGDGYIFTNLNAVADDYAEARLWMPTEQVSTSSFAWLNATQVLQVGPDRFGGLTVLRGDLVQLQIRPTAGQRRCWITKPPSLMISTQRIDAERSTGLFITVQPVSATGDVGDSFNLGFTANLDVEWQLEQLVSGAWVPTDYGTGTSASVSKTVTSSETSWRFWMVAGPWIATTETVTLTPTGAPVTFAFTAEPAATVSTAAASTDTGPLWTWAGGSGTYSTTLTYDDGTVLSFAGTGTSVRAPIRNDHAEQTVAISVNDGLSTLTGSTDLTVTTTAGGPEWTTKPAATVSTYETDPVVLDWSATAGTGGVVNLTVFRNNSQVYAEAARSTYSFDLGTLPIGTYHFRVVARNTTNGLEDWAVTTVTVLEGVPEEPPNPGGEGTGGDYNFAIPGAGTPGSLVSGWVPADNAMTQFFDSETGPPPALTPEELKGLGGWVRWIYISPTGSATANGLTTGTATTWEGFWSRVGSTFGPGDWGLLEDGTHYDNGSLKLGKVGTLSNPIRVVAENHLGARVVSTLTTTSLTGFGGASRYLGFHGIDFDGLSQVVWGFCLGERYSGDTAMGLPVNNIDVWHCHIHHASLSTAHVSTTGTRNIHFFGCEINHAGQNLKKSGNVNDWGPFGELMYFGTGASSAAVTLWAVDWCHVHDTPAGEAIDAKGASNDMRVSHCLIENVRLGSQAAVTRWDGQRGEIGYNIIHNIREVQPGQATAYGWTGATPPYTAPSGWTNSWNFADTYEGAAIYAGGDLDVHHNVMWDLGDTAIIHIGRDVGSGLRVRYNTVGLAPKQDNTGNDSFYRRITSWGSSFLPTTYTGNLTITADTDATTAVTADFVNAQGTGLASADTGLRRGWGYQLASTSSISSTLGAMGQAGTAAPPPPLPSGEPAVASVGAISSGGSIPATSGQTIIVCATSAARDTATSASSPLGTASGFTEIGTAFVHASGFRADHRWFKIDSATGSTTCTVANANRITYWLLEDGSGATSTRGTNQEAYNSGASTCDIGAVTSTGDGCHLVMVAFHSDTGSGSGAVSAPSGYTMAANYTPAYSGTAGPYKNSVTGSTSALTAASSGAGNYSTTSVVVAS